MPLQLAHFPHLLAVGHQLIFEGLEALHKDSEFVYAWLCWYLLLACFKNTV